MNKCVKTLLLTLLLALLAIWVWMGDSLPVHPFCPFHRLTGIPCPGCGGVRAAQYLLAGKVKAALYTNPLSVVACMVVPLIIVGLWIDCIRKTNHVYDFFKRQWSPIVTKVVLVIVVLNWIWNIQKGL